MPPRKKADSSGKVFGLFDEALVLVAGRMLTLTGIVAAIWYMGNSRRPLSWLIIPAVTFVCHDKLETEKDNKRMQAEKMASSGKKQTLARTDELPSWVNYPDVDRLEWMNKIMNQIWPHIGQFVETLLTTTVESSVKENLPDQLKSFKFSRAALGGVPPRLCGIKVYNQRRPGEIYIDVQPSYSSDIHIAVDIQGYRVGIKDFRMDGTLRVVLKPLLNRPPLIGGAVVAFLNKPEIDFDLTNLGEALDIGILDLLKFAIGDAITSIVVLPNRIPIEIAPNLDLTSLKFPRPQGVVRVVIKEGKDLVAKDINWTGKNTSDPFVTVTVGTQTLKTRHISKSLNPEWNEAFELVVDSADGQLLFLEVFDYDTAGDNDPMGKAHMGLEVVKEQGTQDEILPLENVDSGQISLQLEWFWLSSEPSDLDTILKIVEANTASKQATAVLMVYLYSAKSLPMVTGPSGFKYSPKNILCGNKNVPRQPSPKTILSVGQQVKHSCVKEETNDPRWEQGFRFMVTNPNHQNLNLEVIDDDTKKHIGELSIKLKELLSAPDLLKDQKFMMKSSDPGSHFMLRLCLRILTKERNTDWQEEEHFEELVAGDNATSNDVKKETPPSKHETPHPPTENKDIAKKENAPSKDQTPPQQKENLAKEETPPNESESVVAEEKSRLEDQKTNQKAETTTELTQNNYSETSTNVDDGSVSSKTSLKSQKPADSGNETTMDPQPDPESTTHNSKQEASSLRNSKQEASSLRNSIQEVFSLPFGQDLTFGIPRGATVESGSNLLPSEENASITTKSSSTSTLHTSESVASIQGSASRSDDNILSKDIADMVESNSNNQGMQSSVDAEVPSKSSVSSKTSSLQKSSPKSSASAKTSSLQRGSSKSSASSKASSLQSASSKASSLQSASSKASSLQSASSKSTDPSTTSSKE